jgi:ABC-type nitrate/sulfonate/bicarbonate transport system permease component
MEGAPGTDLHGLDPRRADVELPDLEPSAAEPRARRRWYGWIVSDSGARWTSRILCLAAWQAAGELFDRIPTPAGTIEFLIDEAQRGDLLPNIGMTLQRASIALSIVLVLGIVLGFAMGRWWPVRSFFTDLVMVGIALPAFIWALLGVMWWGFSEVAPIFVCCVSATPMLIVNTREGAEAVDVNLRKMSDAYRVPWTRQFRSLVLPTMSEYIMAGFRFAVLAGWGAILLVEWFGNESGIGWAAQYWYDAGNFNGLMGWGLVMLVVIIAIDRLVMQRVLARTRRWRSREAKAWT